MTMTTVPLYSNKASASGEGVLYVNIGAILFAPLTGIGRFVARLVEALSTHTALRLVAFGSLSPQLLSGEEIHLCPKCLSHRCDDDLEAWVQDVLAQPRYRFDAQGARNRACLWTHLRPETRYFAREVGVLYDFTPLLTPWAHAAETRSDFGRLFGETLLLCDAAVAISQATRNDARWLCALPDNSIAVGYPGPSLCVEGHAHSTSVQRRDNLILVVSAVEPRKNAEFLLDWYLNTDVLPAGTELCWVGPRAHWGDVGTRIEHLSRTQRGLTAKGREITFLGQVTDARLCELYQQAGFTIYPSLYEGFGFPVLDALRHEAPVLCGFHSSLKEFEGPGVFYFDVCDTASLDMAYHEMRGSGVLQCGIGRTDLDIRFSWDNLARQVLELCRVPGG